MKVIYPGSFDPPTYGHLDIIQRLSSMFDEVIVALLVNGSKEPLFTLEERIEMIRSDVEGHDLKNVTIKTFDGLMVNFAKEEDTTIIARGLRGMADYEYEKNIARVNGSLYEGLETVFLLSSPKYSFISSSVVKEVASFGGDISSFVSDDVEIKMKEKYKY
ncbi:MULTISPECIES: pantetheine-phosphate adenylyltransferase [Anaerococcus]|jgi:pantetheine-phosphate adenylyltransferase|uniref:Phosphopantetheine adenylyltransferase n=1 Tax=Anaerococcus octavius TaxID=54007 RepID=A0A2I1M9H5_9FIRM|nr:MULTISPECIES: pantetheine-phosphate adenylyltransferase [Anaerococcus]MBS6105843.1 pantetheine-phosphate adenylyltransferase [Anaerococcus sp.]MDU2598171.1 pantetheine-phosphate adenylyltransferase [Anaerococcus sp.]MDU3177026.1 pantetheine-phosphate adenylyltransferase [Anaerococcus sp.]MDU4025511.1 pantetheine-phosphate adenylyltransferase [Anaerococcus sp.]MDU5229213.1 pantetheine-phosphate adenylyltransferase [Anaerococcus sp.]